MQRIQALASIAGLMALFSQSTIAHSGQQTIYEVSDLIHTIMTVVVASVIISAAIYKQRIRKVKRKKAIDPDV